MYTANDARQDFFFPLKGMVTGSGATREVREFPLELTFGSC